MIWKTAIHDLYGALEKLEARVAGQQGCTVDEVFSLWHELSVRLREADGTIYLVGNGASASMASHFAADLAKNGGIRTKVFTDLSEVTAISNDVGFDQVFALPLERYAREGDMLVAVSSSGRSPNILNGVRAAHGRRVTVVTLSGFAADNPLREAGDINFYVPSGSYGLAETCHAAILHHWMDGLAVANLP